MPTYILQGLTEEVFQSREFAQRESDRGNVHIEENIDTKVTEISFTASSNKEAREVANRDYPELVRIRRLLRIVP